MKVTQKKCAIPGCEELYKQGHYWHVGKKENHPEWHPKEKNATKRNALYAKEFPHKWIEVEVEVADDYVPPSRSKRTTHPPSAPPNEEPVSPFTELFPDREALKEEILERMARIGWEKTFGKDSPARHLSGIQRLVTPKKVG